MVCASVERSCSFWGAAESNPLHPFTFSAADTQGEGRIFPHVSRYCGAASGYDPNSVSRDRDTVTAVTSVQAGKGPAKDTVLLDKYKVEGTLGFGGMGLV